MDEDEASGVLARKEGVIDRGFALEGEGAAGVDSL